MSGSVLNHALTVSISYAAFAAWRTASGSDSGDEADDSEDDSSSESEEAPDAPSLDAPSPGNDAPQLQWAIVENFVNAQCLSLRLFVRRATVIANGQTRPPAVSLSSVYADFVAC